MKKDIHPKEYRLVVFEDVGIGKRWLTRSTVKTDRTTQWEDGQDYPHFTVEISSYSHPFYTGQQRFVDSEGRVDKFKKKYKR